jgi:hypothetical protein
MYKLVRKRDGLVKQSNKIKFLEFDDNGFYLKDYDKAAIGLSLLMSPFNKFFTWQTTLITEILQDTENYLHFKTENSEYELFKTEDIVNEIDIYNDLF